MIFVTALCPECGNEPEDSVCEICGYEGEKYGWALQTLYLPNNRVHPTCSYCGADDGKHELDCWVAHNMLADNASG